MTPAKKRRTIVFESLTFFTLPLTIVFALLGLRVYYLNAALRLRGDLAAATLGRLGISLIDFEDCRDIDFSRGDADTRGLAHSILVEMFPDEGALRLFGGLFPGIQDIERKLKIIIHETVATEMGGFSKLLCWIEDYAGTNGKVFVFARNNLFREIALRVSFPNCVNLLPAAFSYATKPLGLIARILWNSANALRSRIASGPRSGHGRNRSETPMGIDPPDISRFPILFFPHQSVFYGNLFLKDQFYSPDQDSPLHISKILHIELSRSFADEIPGELHERILRYYNENRINSCLLPRVSKRRRGGYLLDFCAFAYRHLAEARRLDMPAKFFVVHLFLKTYIKYREYAEVLERFEGAKIALVGYDILFPRTLSLALESRGITTVATQERFVTTFYNNFNFIVDTYLTCSEMCADYIRGKKYTYTRRRKAIGFIRGDVMHRYCGAPPDERYARIKKDHHLIVALDYHSLQDRYSNGRQLVINWKANKAFYGDLIRLARRFPKIHIVIRSKDDIWCRLPVMREIAEAISSLANIEVNRDYDELNMSYKIVSMADMVIAKHTSLGDESLAAGKPVLFYDFMPNARRVVSRVFDYEGQPVFVYSYEEMEARVKALVEDGFFMEGDSFERMRERFFGRFFDGRVRERLHRELARLCASRGVGRPGGNCSGA